MQSSISPGSKRLENPSENHFCTGMSTSLSDSALSHGCPCLPHPCLQQQYRLRLPETIPIPESAPIQPINPYGFSKAAVEQMLTDLNSSAPNTWRIASPLLQPCGRPSRRPHRRRPPRHPQQPLPLHLPGRCRTSRETQDFWQRLALWHRQHDYIHVMDLAEGHKAALETLLNQGAQHITCNLGSGDGLVCLT